MIAQTGPANNTTDYTFNDLDQLTAISGPNNTASYFYDPLGNRVSQTVNNASTNFQTVTTNFQIDPIGLGNVVAAFSGTGVYHNNSGLLAHYTYGLGLVSQVGATGAAAYYDFGRTGNAIGITNAAGSCVDRYSYLPSAGRPSSQPAITNPFTYVGQFGVTGDGSGLLHMGFRNFDPVNGQFISNDPLGLGGGDGNVRRYVGNEPIVLTDSSGLGDSIPAGVSFRGFWAVSGN